MLEVRAVGRPGGPDDHDRVLAAAGRGALQRVEQERRVVAHRPDVVAREQLGQQAAHRDPVLQHVGDPGGSAHVVLEHLPAAVRVAHEVAAGHVRPHAAGRPDAVGGARERRARDHELPWDDSLPDDLLLVVDVLHEAVQCPHPLGEPALDRAPLLRRQDARDEVEREGTVLGRPVRAGGVEGDALLDEDRVAALARGAKPLAPEPAQRGGEGRGGRARRPGRVEELVEEAGRGAVVELGVRRGAHSGELYPDGRFCRSPGRGT